MTQSNTMHVVFGSGPLGLSVVDELLARGKPVRLVNRSGKANVPTGVKVIGADTDAMRWLMPPSGCEIRPLCRCAGRCARQRNRVAPGLD